MRVAEAIGATLGRLGVRDVFGVIGSGNFHVTNALCGAGARFVAARHECAAVSMADGYARVSGEVGVASVHQGPGLTNTLTSLTEAAKSRTPLLLLAAEAPAAALTSNFRVDQAALVRAAGAVAERAYSPATAIADTVRAFRRARAERRPVALMLPLDVQQGEAPEPLPTALVGPELRAPRPSPASVTALADLVQAAQLPVIIAGRGAVLAGAREPLERLAERIGALLATSAVGNGLFAGNPYSLGISGGFAAPLAISLLASADLVMGFGATLNNWTTRHGSLIAPAARIAQVDLDAETIGLHRQVDVGVVGDAAEAALALDEELARRGHRDDGFRTGDIADRIASRRWRDEPYELAGMVVSDAAGAGAAGAGPAPADTGEGHGAAGDGGVDSGADAGEGPAVGADGEGWIDPRTLSIALDDLLPAERTLAIDSGHFMGWPAMYMAVPDAAGFVFTQAFQSIGLGLSSAIGAAVARPDRVTVAAIGDGGAMMALGELDTVARLGLPMLVVVYNDAAYGAEVHHFDDGEPLDLVRFPDSDFAALARAAGAQAITVRSRDDLSPVAKWAAAPDGPLVVDAKVHPGVRASWLEEAFRGG
jgi:thiamine pyrophosphate-dependent acetolactate synthase large subunit-like protein